MNSTTPSDPQPPSPSRQIVIGVGQYDFLSFGVDGDIADVVPSGLFAEIFEAGDSWRRRRLADAMLALHEVVSA